MDSPPTEFQAIFIPVDDAHVFEEMLEQGRLLVEDGKCVMLIPYSKSESGHPMM